MIAAPLIRPVLLAFSLAASLGAAWGQTLSVTPNPATAGKAFTLYLQGVPQNSCYTAFSRESVMVSGNRIDLRYTVASYAVPLSAAAGAEPIPCPLLDARDAKVAPSMPSFAMPALKAGSYEVWATNMPECLYSQPSCKIAVKPESAGVLKVESAPEPAYTINPDSAPAGQAFALQLLSYDFACGTAYDSLSAVVADGAITLSFLDRPNPAAICPAIYMPYGPTFRLPALKEGAYKVKVNRLSAGGTVDAGVLTITNAAVRKSWYLKTKKVVAEKAFAMQLLRDDIGNCQTSFADEAVTISAKSITVFFTMEQHPERVCIQNIQPYGPTFEMPAMKTGAYPVYAVVCEGKAGACQATADVASIVDTLLVSAASSVRMSGLRAHGPKVEMRGQAAVFALPEGEAGTWRAELMTLDGRVLGRTTVAGAAGQRVTVSVGRAPANAVSLLRLTSPDGAQRFLPIVR
jgi:hypothetical protein